MDEKILVMITAGSKEEAVTIVNALLKERLIACANLVGNIRSLYHWKGEICDDAETLLFCKSRRALFPQLSERVKSLHSYDVPEIIALPLVEGWAPYLQWIDEETATKSSSA